MQLGPWRYVPAGAAAIDDYTAESRLWFFSRHGSEIRREQGEAGIDLAAGKGVSYAARWIRPAADAAYTRVDLEVALDGVSENSRGIGAMLGVVSFDARGRRLAHWPKRLFLGSGSAPWRRVSLVVPWKAESWAGEVAMMRLELVNAGEEGRVSLRGIEIAALGDAVWYPWAHRTLTAGWSLLGLFAVSVALRHARPRAAALAAIAAALVIAVGGVLPEPVFRDLSDPIERPLLALGRALVGPAPVATAEQRAKPPARPAPVPSEGQAPSDTATPAPAPSPTPSETGAGVEMAELTREGLLWVQQAVGHKIMHATGFGGLALLVAFVAPPVGLLHMLGIAGFAGVTEVLQMLTVTRSAHLGDIVVDLLGAAGGLALGVAVRLIFARWRARAPVRA